MAETCPNIVTKTRCAVVTGGNKGIGFEICKQLASNGIMVVLTSKDITEGLEAVEKLKNSNHENVVFHQLDVTDPITTMTQEEILGIYQKPETKELVTETYELAEECLKTNYYGVKSVTEVLIPLLQLSDSPRIVNVSSSYGSLKNIFNQTAAEILGDGGALTEERIDMVLNMFLKDFKEDLIETKGWPSLGAAYTISKACLNAYTRVLAKKIPKFRVNCVCPGYVKTEMNYGLGIYTVEEGAKHPVTVALFPDDGPSGFFYDRSEVSVF
ncbi:hypothetical protein MKX01_029256 [Papaver californicum]|nr:hypothetical protein MKX01_029256 [Papaver californicum]